MLTPNTNECLEKRERISDLHEQVAKAFEYEERLAQLLQRPDQNEQALDLTKSLASAQLDSRSIDEDGRILDFSRRRLLSLTKAREPRLRPMRNQG
jgi:hypothetical protein